MLRTMCGKKAGAAIEEATHGRLIRLSIAAPAFLPHMVRNIAGALVAVGRGAWPVAAIAEVLAAADRRRAAPTAPPHGVCLERVAYDEAWFGAWYTDERARGGATEPPIALDEAIDRAAGTSPVRPPRATGARE
jgi:hypothetical protein